MQMHASLQRKFSFSYIAIILAVLLLLNTYPLITSENLTFRSKQSSLQGSVSVMVTVWRRTVSLCWILPVTNSPMR